MARDGLAGTLHAEQVSQNCPDLIGVSAPIDQTVQGIKLAAAWPGPEVLRPPKTKNQPPTMGDSNMAG